MKLLKLETALELSLKLNTKANFQTWSILVAFQVSSHIHNSFLQVKPGQVRVNYCPAGARNKRKATVKMRRNSSRHQIDHVQNSLFIIYLFNRSTLFKNSNSKELKLKRKKNRSNKKFSLTDRQMDIMICRVYIYIVVQCSLNELVK